jgi:NADH dehydrogenase FAD-containing subunit
VVGGGPTGVELAGELTDFLYNEDGMGGECMAVVQILW